jgi:hypothetical protein
MSIIELTHGGILTRGKGSLDIFVSYRDVPKSEDQPLHLAVKDPNSGVKEPSGIIETVPSSKVYTGKSWTKRRIDFPDGSYVRFTIKQMRGGQIGAFRHSFHNFVISPRESAPLQELRISLPADERSNLSAVYIIGRYDILKPDEIQERGLNKGASGANDMATYDFAALDDILTLTVKERSGRPRAKSKVLINKATGKGVARIRRPRRINLPS